jgi:hypothetical protein
MKNIGQIQATEKPTKNEISRADQHSPPWSQGSGSGIHASQRVEKNDQIADDVVYFHDDSCAGRFKQKSELRSSNQLKKLSLLHSFRRLSGF